MDVVCVGDCGIDHYLSSNEKRFGGITANFARHARAQFDPEDTIRIVSCVGDDDDSNLVLSSLGTSGIDCHVTRLSGTTPVQYIEIGADGERQFVRYDEGVLGRFSFGPPEQALIADCDLLVAPVFLQMVDLYDQLMGIRTRGLVAIDFADFQQHPDFSLLERHIDRIGIGFFGLSLTDRDTIASIAALASRSGKLLVVTLGASGSLAFHGDRCHECPADSVDRVIDTTGAGDAFAAAFLARYCHKASVRESMQSGAALSARVVGHYGSYLLPDDVDAR